MTAVPDDIFREAADAGIDEERLFEIAGSYPATYPIIAANPKAYPDLLDWLREVGDPFTLAVLDERAKGMTGGAAYEAARAKFSGEARADGDEPTERVDAAAEEDRGQDTQLTEVVDPHRADAYPATSSADDHVTRAMAPVAGEVRRTSVMPRERLTPTPAQGIEQPPAIPPTQPGYGGYPQQGYQAPYAAGSYPPHERAEEKKRPTGLIVALVLLLVLALTGLGLSYYLLMNKDDSPGAASTVTSSQAGREGETTQAEPTEEESETPSQSETRFPAPAGAASSRNFHMPSNNINCQIDDADTRCTIFEASFGDCGGPTTVTLSKNGLAQTCDASRAVNSGAGGILIYDTATTYKDYACSSSTAGVKCWDVRTGEGFLLARSGVSPTHE